MRRATALAVALTLATAHPAVAQTVVHGSVLDAGTGGPLQGALVTARTAQRATTTDRMGRFSLVLAGFPDTLVITQADRALTRVPLDTAPREPLHIRLEREAVLLSDVIVTASGEAARPLDDVGRWHVPLATAREVPPVVESDVLRSLTLVPAVTFSTPLSSRPLVRGYDAGESSVRIDGFEVFNLYHVGRIFAAFPADAVRDVSVAAAPHGAATGGTLSGTVDIAGQVGEAGGLHGGVDLSLASTSVWVGGGGAGARWFGAVRSAHLAVLDATSDVGIPYNFQDIYLNALLSAGGRPAARLTAFASRDHLFDRDLGSGMDWSNLLIGGRWHALDRGRLAASVWGTASRFAEDVADIPARYSRIDVRNRFARGAVGADATVLGDRTRLNLGLSLGHRAIGNRITPRSGEDFVTADEDFRLTELGAYAEAAATLGRSALSAGVRVDGAGDTWIVQPRLRFSVPLGGRASMGFAAGRTGRLFHLVSDPQSEPDLVFYDFWFNAGEDGVPVPVVDHATVDVDVARGPWAARVSLYASRARGLIELRPATDQQPGAAAPFRQGKGRSGGVEVQVGLRGGEDNARSLSLSYVLGLAERDWGAGWVPWVQDRRHMVRLLGSMRFGRRWSLSAAAEAMSGAPLTPVDGVLIVAIPNPDSSGLDRALPGSPAYVYGPEHTARSNGTLRFDLGGRYAFTGPWQTRATLGFSVLNVGFGPVAPLQPVDPDFDPGVGSRGRVRYERLFDLPAVPTLTLRVEF